MQVATLWHCITLNTIISGSSNLSNYTNLYSTIGESGKITYTTIYLKQTIQAALQPVWFCVEATAKGDTLLHILSEF